MKQSGNTPLLKQRLNINVRTGVIVLGTDLRNLVGIPSYPVAESFFRLNIRFSTSALSVGNSAKELGLEDDPV